MKFILDLPPFQSEAGQINFKEKLFFSGSCFADKIGDFFQRNHFHCRVNPHGILFNPLVLADSLRRINELDFYRTEDLLTGDGRARSWYHHGKFSSDNPNNLLTEINEGLVSAHDFLKETQWVIITFGSAFAWLHADRNHYVANCHKMPGRFFEKKLVQADEIILRWKELISQIRMLNPTLKFIFSVSPVRYVRDGLIQNNRSKAELIRAVHSICEMEHVVYFPAFEIVTDVLRDYRFFADDMVHPSPQAIDYVLERFCSTFLDSESCLVVEEMKKLERLRNHKVLNPENLSKHIQQLEENEKDLKKRFSGLRWGT